MQVESVACTCRLYSQILCRVWSTTVLAIGINSTSLRLRNIQYISNIIRIPAHPVIRIPVVKVSRSAAFHPMTYAKAVEPWRDGVHISQQILAIITNKKNTWAGYGCSRKHRLRPRSDFSTTGETIGDSRHREICNHIWRWSKSSKSNPL